jgi:hypothetical protein
MTVSTRNSWHLALIAALIAAACSESDRPRAALGTSTGGTPSGSGPADGGEYPGSGATSASAGEAGAGGQPTLAGQPSGGAAHAGDAGNEGFAGASDGGEPPGPEPLPEPTCVGTGELSGAVKLALSTEGADQFGSITPDERVLAWTVVDGNKVTLHYSRRESEGADFGAASTLELADAAADSVTLSADGLRLVYVNSDRRGFSQLVRAAVDEPFIDADSRDFVPIAESAQALAEDEHLGDPVLGADDSTLLYSRYGAERSATLLGTLRFSVFAPWPAGTELPVAPSLETVGDARQRPTAISLDRQTLFLWNAATATQTVAMLSHQTSKYDVAFALEDARGAAPNAACSRVYFDRDGDLWTADLR